MVCFAPVETRICGRVYSSALSRRNLATIASLSSGMPSTARVAREPAADRRDAGVGDVRGRVEVGLADAEADDVVALGLEPGDAAGEGDGGRGLDALDALGEGDGHGGFPGAEGDAVS